MAEMEENIESVDEADAVSPTSIHKSKEAHKEAVFARGEQIVTEIEEEKEAVVAD